MNSLQSGGAKAADLIRWANGQVAPVLALDVPFGIDAGTGEVRDPAIRASATLALALPKEGGFAPPARRGYVGELYLADIGVPSSSTAVRPWDCPSAACSRKARS